EDVEAHAGAGGCQFSDPPPRGPAVVGGHARGLGPADRPAPQGSSCREECRARGRQRERGDDGAGPPETEERCREREGTEDREEGACATPPRRRAAPRIARVATVAARSVAAVEITATVGLDE